VRKGFLFLAEATISLIIALFIMVGFSSFYEEKNSTYVLQRMDDLAKIWNKKGFDFSLVETLFEKERVSVSYEGKNYFKAGSGKELYVQEFLLYDEKKEEFNNLKISVWD
jgi:hypothetical protein